MSPTVQLAMPPMEVQKVNRAQRPALKTVNPVNLLRVTREAIRRAGLSQTWFAATLGISEPLVSAQLADHATEKHLSMRRLGRVQEFSFWREFILLLAEDIGLRVVVLDEEQHAALTNLQNSSATFARVMSR